MNTMVPVLKASFKSDKAELPSVNQQVLGYVFQKKELLQQALTHPSSGSPRIPFQRLEFLGDKVLGVTVADMLYHSFPDADEGELAHYLDTLVCRKALAMIAKNVGIPDLLKCVLPVDEQETTRVTVLSDALEAVVGAIYLDGGLSVVTKVIQKLWAPLFPQLNKAVQHPKELLQKHTHAQFKTLPVYKVISQMGPPHKPEYTVECQVGGRVVVCKGGSKKSAERVCAQEMLKKLQV